MSPKEIQKRIDALAKANEKIQRPASKQIDKFNKQIKVLEAKRDKVKDKADAAYTKYKEAIKKLEAKLPQQPGKVAEAFNVGKNPPKSELDKVFSEKPGLVKKAEAAAKAVPKKGKK